MKRQVLLIVLLSSSQMALAQQRPDAGQQLQQIQQIPQPPEIESEVPDALFNRPAVATAPEGDGGAQLQVNALRVTGQTLFSEQELIAATGFAPGSHSLSDLRKLAAKITRHYNDRGYFLAQAYLPAQDIVGDIVRIAVVEGRYGDIKVQANGSPAIGAARHALAGLATGDAIALAPLERRLLLLSDVPGLRVQSTLSPGGAVGTSDLLVDVRRGRSVAGSIEADNAGNRFTGAYRGGGSLSFNNLTGHGDVLGVRGLVSNSGLAYGRASYQRLLGNSTVGIAFSHINYALGREFRLLDADGTADILSLYGSHPLLRSRNTNLNALAGLDAKFFRDRIGAASTDSRRRAQVGTVGLSGNHRDFVGGGGWTQFSVTATGGSLDIRDPVTRAVDRATAKTAGGYGKVQAGLARLQRLTDDLSVYVAVRGQLASKNLDSAEKMGLGGAYAVRAYPEGEAYGDEGYVATAEARMMLPRLTALPGQLQLFGFVDVGATKFAKDPWFVGPNTAHRSGIGAGLGWTSPNNFLVKGTYAHKLGDQEVTSQRDRDGRFWFQIAKLF